MRPTVTQALFMSKKEATRTPRRRARLPGRPRGVARLQIQVSEQHRAKLAGLTAARGDTARRVVERALDVLWLLDQNGNAALVARGADGAPTTAEIPLP